ncbi:arylamine N-acetyltransferase family protein [Rufibacter psychrotolerans]|uniref:arylamine N-acetyltransferase family protein n=1 Tax=Rufibacter psychrotolerans TaxID=2812556 RepID=UPI0019682ADE|nr:arylamine N-acetyltransferase [Rufibacter sp. SYSU D00308]
MTTIAPVAPVKTFFKINKEGLNISRYLARIGYTGDTAPTLETLRQLHYLHALTFPFENLNPFLKKPVPLDIETLQRKMVEDARGGYCFEQNQLFSHALQALGYKVKGLAARVLWNVPGGVTTARAHMLLLVEVEGEEYLADVGFGGLSLTAPLRLHDLSEQRTTHETFRLVPLEDEYVLQARIQDTWKPLYRFGLQEQFTADYEVSNWFTSTHPRSPFVTGLLVAKVTPEARYCLRNNELSVHYVHGKSKRQFITTPGQLYTILKEGFDLPVSYTPELDQALRFILQPLN